MLKDLGFIKRSSDEALRMANNDLAISMDNINKYSVLFLDKFLIGNKMPHDSI